MIRIQWINCSHARIITDREGVLKELQDRFKFRPPGWQFNPKYKSNRWDGWIRLVKANGIFPVGLTSEMMKYLLSQDYKISLSEEYAAFKDEFSYAQEDFDLPNELWEHQEDGIKHALAKKRCVLLSPTSSGKSNIIYCLARVMQNHNMKTLIVVPSVMLVNQMTADFEEYSMLNGWDVREHVHQIFDGAEKNSVKPITISTWQSLQNVKDSRFFEQFDAVFNDEVHGAKADELSSILENCVNAFFRVGLTGTLDGYVANEMTIVGHFGPVKRLTTTKELQDAGIATPVEIEAHIIKYTDPQFIKAVKGLPYKSEIEIVCKKRSRNVYIADIAGTAEGNTLVLCNFVDEHAIPLAETIKEKYPEKNVFVLSSKSGTSKNGVITVSKSKDREMLRRICETRSDLVIVSTYGLMSTGVSIKNLHVAIFAHPLKGSIRILQSIGRLLRKHASKEMSRVVDIADDMRGDRKAENFALKHFMIRAGIYNKEKFPLKIVEAEIKV